MEPETQSKAGRSEAHCAAPSRLRSLERRNPTPKHPAHPRRSLRPEQATDPSQRRGRPAPLTMNTVGLRGAWLAAPCPGGRAGSSGGSGGGGASGGGSAGGRGRQSAQSRADARGRPIRALRVGLSGLARGDPGRRRARRGGRLEPGSPTLWGWTPAAPRCSERRLGLWCPHRPPAGRRRSCGKGASAGSQRSSAPFPLTEEKRALTHTSDESR